MDLTNATLQECCAAIRKDWKNINFAAKPYLEAMESLQNLSQNYGLDSGKSMSLYFRSNAATWKGEVAKAVKKRLQVLEKEAKYTSPY
jgi:hypothetical protein